MSLVTNVKVKLLLFVSLLGILLIISAPLVSSVFVNLINPTETVTTSSTATVFVDPASFIMDYDDLPVGSNFNVHVNVSDVTDLFTWQLNMSWDPSILNVSGSTGGEFLARSPNQTSSEELGVVINASDNVMGYSGMAESILGNVSGITGSGRLVSVEFLVVGYGCCNLTINLDGTLSTALLNSTGDSMAFTTVNGFFKNKLNGDANGDGYVNSLDLGKINAHWSPAIGPPEWSLGYSPCVDPNNDDYINSLDVGTINANWGRTIY